MPTGSALLDFSFMTQLERVSVKGSLKVNGSFEKL
jgi:hypothetical protein